MSAAECCGAVAASARGFVVPKDPLKFSTHPGTGWIACLVIHREYSSSISTLSGHFWSIIFVPTLKFPCSTDFGLIRFLSITLTKLNRQESVFLFSLSLFFIITGSKVRLIISDRHILTLLLLAINIDSMIRHILAHQRQSSWNNCFRSTEYNGFITLFQSRRSRSSRAPLPAPKFPSAISTARPKVVRPRTSSSRPGRVQK